VNQRIRAVDSDVQVLRLAAFGELLDRPLARPRFTALLLGLFGIVALLLATIGSYAVMAAHVRQRDREIALRMALGATARIVRRAVLTEAVSLAGLGAIVGVGCAVAATRFLDGMLYEVNPLDPTAIAAAAMLLVVAAVLASYGPVRRAAHADVMTTLRSQ
jgi:putative ABC transport system permease protein